MKQNIWLKYLLISVLGVLSIIIPVFLQSDFKQFQSPHFPIIRTGIEGISIWSFALLFLTGFAMKFFTKLFGWKIGLTMKALFPIMAVLEMVVESSSN
jgi:hypothetical protein